MFTGIVQAIGRVRALTRPTPDSANADLSIDLLGLDPASVALGDSLAVNGACLTVAGLYPGGVRADLSAETLACTTLGALVTGAAVNLEAALTLASRLGGHLVSGHIDGVGKIETLTDSGAARQAWIALPPDLERYIVAKGSICVDGVSLTVNAVKGARFAVTLIPHTLNTTTLGSYRQGQRVNLEVDLLARYVERLLSGRDDRGGLPTADW